MQEQVSEKVEGAANTASEVAAATQEKGMISLNFHKILHFKCLAADVQEQVSEKVEAAANTASEVAAGAQEKVEEAKDAASEVAADAQAKSEGKAMPHIILCLYFSI